MAIQFDPIEKRIVLDTAYVDTTELYSEWKRWALSGDNMKYAWAFSTVGGDPIGGGRFIPPFLFLQNGWRIKPMENDHTLVIAGGSVYTVEGDEPVVATNDPHNIIVRWQDPVAAIGVSEGGSGGGITGAQIQAIMEAVLATTTVKADIKKVNGVTVKGTGVEGDTWGPQ